MMNFSRKNVNFHDLVSIVTGFKEVGKKVVLCHGCFDWFHIGHLWHLNSAKKYGDILVVTVTPDRYVNKGPGRPMFNEQNRMEMLAAIEIVDYVSLNLWESAVETIKLLKVDYFAKGPDYLQNDININDNIYLELNAAEEVGTKVVYTTDEKFSSSEILKKWCKNFLEKCKERR